MSLERPNKISLFSTTALIVGCLIGSGIFVVTGPLTAEVGPGLFIGYLIALVPAVGMGLTFAQLGSAMPTTATIYTYSTRLVHPFVGFLSGWGYAIAGMAITALVALGFSSYLSPLIPGLNVELGAVGILLTYFLINILGLRSSSAVNNSIVIGIVLVLAAFVFFGLPAMDVGLGRPLFPHGFGPVLTASAALFFAYLGFSVATDIGEEIKNPGRTIPLAIVAGAAIVAALYVGVSFVLPRIMHWKELGEMNAALYETASRSMPASFAPLVLAGGLLAIMSSLHAGLIINSRNIYAMSRDGWIPEVFTRKTNTGAPIWALSAMVIGPTILVYTEFGIAELAAMSSALVLVTTAILAWTPLVIVRKHREKYESARLRFPVPLIYAIAVITSVSSIILIIASVDANNRFWLFIVGCFVPGIVVYQLNKGKALPRLQNQ